VDFGELRVMVVEDHDFQRRVAVQLLKGVGVAAVHEAGNGLDALERLALLREVPDIVISDLDMPGMDGIEFIRHIAERRLAHAVAVTSNLEPAMLSTVEAMARAYGLQVLGAIEKPITARRLNQLLSHYRRPDVAAAAVRAPSEAALTAEVVREALDRREFIVHYQPKVDLRSGQPCGLEALVRWDRPGWGLVGPGDFLPFLERVGLIDALTESVLEQACAAHRAWEVAASLQPVSINVSMLSLTDVGIADRYLALARRYHVDPGHLVIEVTESALMRDAARSLDVLARLRLKGFGLSIDDFGTGYSSLSQLGSIPFTELKVDQSFVHGAVDDPRRRAIVEASLELARKMKLTSVAEGVETRAEWDLLGRLGCDQAQGWFVSKALPADRVADWIRVRADQYRG